MNRSDSSHRSFSTQQLRAALDDVGDPGRPDYLPDIVAQASRTRQRPAWAILERWISVDTAPLPRQGVPRAALVLATLALLVAALTAGIVSFGSPRPQPERLPGVPLGIFEAVSGRIIFQSVDFDGGHGLATVDPIAPSASGVKDFRNVLDRPLGWSRDGTKLLLQREVLGPDDCCPELLYLLNSDGTETHLFEGPRYTFGAAIAPDGSRVVFAAGAYRGPAALFIVDTHGGEPVQIAATGETPTFSPDGTRIAYVVPGPTAQVWVADADGSNARPIVAGGPALINAAVGGLAWSPAGDRIAIAIRAGEESVAIYTVAPDGSAFTEVVTSGDDPYWSPDGSRFAYTIPGDYQSGAGPIGFAIVDADGSNVREFDFGISGPWHPGVLPTVR